MNVHASQVAQFERAAFAADAETRRQPSRRMLRMRLHASLVVLDLMCIVGGFVVARALYPDASQVQSVRIAEMFLPVYFVIAFSLRAYSTEIIEHISRGVARALQALMLTASAVILAAFYLKFADDMSRMIFGLGFAIAAVSLGLARTAFIHRARSVLGGNPYQVVFLTEGDVPASLGSNVTVIPASNFDPQAECPIMYDRLAQVLADADRVVVSCAVERRMAWAHALQGANVQAEIISQELSQIAPRGVSDFAGAPTLVVAQGPLSLPDRLVKRGFDVAVAGAALLFFAPLFLVLALAIKLESPGPVFFVQTRIGRGNRLFRMMKFRSMRAETSDGAGTASTARDDNRITRIGAIIRKTSIDELPQLVNVLTGDMSLVGPRPHALGSRAEDMLFWEIDRRYWYRHASKPGLTGLAQVRGFRGATEHHDDLKNRLKADLEYLNGWSIWRDFKIIAMTFGVLVHKNAY